MKKNSGLFNIINISYGLLFLLFTYSMVFYVFTRWKEFSPNISFNIAVAIGAVICILAIIKLLYSLNKKNRKILRIIIILVLFIAQFYLFWKTSRVAGWDAQIVTETVRDGYTDMLYFAKWPNNIFMTSAWQIYIYITDFLYFISPLKRMIILNIFIADISILLLYLSSKRVFGEISAEISLVLSIILVGFSPWISVVYTDVAALVFPIAIIYCIIRIVQAKNEKEKNITSFLLSIIIIIGSYIKVTVAILLIAMILVLLFRKLLKFDIKLHKNQLISFIIGCGVAFSLVTAITYEANNRIKTELPYQNSRGIHYYLEVGLYNYGYGNWNFETFNWTNENSNKEDYTENASKRILDLVKEYGALGMAEHSFLKLLWCGTDGTFAYGMEGAFHAEGQDTSDSVKYFLQNYIYHSSDFYQNTLSQILQGVWITVCILSVFSGFFNKNMISFIAKLSIGGLFLFLMIFESRSRYVFLYLPVIIFAAQTNFDFLYSKLKLNNKNGEENETKSFISDSGNTNSDSSTITV